MTVTGEVELIAVVQVGNEAWTAVREDGNVISVNESVPIVGTHSLLLISICC